MQTTQVAVKHKDELSVNFAKKNRIVNVNLSRVFQESMHSVKLFLVFPKKYCAANINYELPFLKKIYDHYPSSIVVGRISGTKYNLKTIISEKSSEKTNIVELTLRENLKNEVKLPIIFLVNQKGLVLFSRKSVFGDIESLKLFYSKVDFFLSQIYNKKQILNLKSLNYESTQI